jgi:hypothetical protein
MQTSSEPTPFDGIMKLMMGGWISQAVGVLCRLRVFDEVAAGITDVDVMAKRLGVAADALHRVMRAGAMVGVLTRQGPRSFELTSAGHVLRSDTPGSMRALFDATTAPGHWLPLGRLDDCVRTGSSVVGSALSPHDDIWAYYAANPEEGRAFSDGMAGLSELAMMAIGTVWSPPPAETVVDVGGGHGAFVSYVLSRLPAARGTILDLPHVIETAKPAIARNGLADRIECVAGDFLREVPKGADLYLLKNILHDWDDERARTILANVRSAMNAGTTVVAVEMLIPEDGTDSPAILVDLDMLVMLPGRERTASEMRELYRSAGLYLHNVVPSPSPFFLLEASAI